jgi:hypothetical protein
LADVDKKKLRAEVLFTAVFSILILALFFVLLSSNGLILGNDSAIHLERAITFLNNGRIPLGDIAWYPPLYHIMLSTFMSFTGAMSASQMIFVMKCVTALIDWLVVFSVYLIASKLFSKKTGVLAAALLLLCFPFYEINFFGSYTSLLSLAFMALVFMYISLPLKGIGNALMTFVLTFSLVMSHQLATFLAVFILPPFILLVLVKSKGNYPKVLIAAFLGGAIAFFLYYFQAIVPHLDVLINHVFFQIKSNVYQLPAVSLQGFDLNFGFIAVFGIAGMVFAFFKLRSDKKLSAYFLLLLSFLVPFFFSQSHAWGWFLPYHWFVYYLMPAFVILAAVVFSFVIKLAIDSYRNNQRKWKNWALKGFTVSLIVLMSFLLVFRFQTVTENLDESIAYYSLSDVDAYDAGTWLRNNYPEATTTVVTVRPGSWFGIFAGTPTIASVEPTVDRNGPAESVLDLAYEVEHSLTLVRAYESKANISDENFVLLNGVWKRATYSAENSSYLYYQDENGFGRFLDLSSLSKQITLDVSESAKKIVVTYSNDVLVLTKNILFFNDTYPVTVVWQISAFKGDLNKVALHVTYNFDLALSFDKANVPDVLKWANPLDYPSKTDSNLWAITSFSRENFTGNYIDIYDERNGTAFAIKFNDIPEFGNIGALGGRKIDGLRFEYQFTKIQNGDSVSISYQILAFTQSSLPQFQQPTQINDMFNVKMEESMVNFREFATIIRDMNVGFVVYDVRQFDPSILRSKWLQVVYSNDKYILCKVSSIHP